MYKNREIIRKKEKKRKIESILIIWFHLQYTQQS